MPEKLVEKKNLIVKRSTLPNAGKGLFAKKKIPKGTRIVEYTGKITTWKEAETDDNGEIYQVSYKHVIDARPFKNALAKYANDARGITRIKGLTNNAEYEEDGLKVYIKAIKDIPAGAEILVGYGKDYWDAIRHNRKQDEIKAYNASLKARNGATAPRNGKTHVNGKVKRK